MTIYKISTQKEIHIVHMFVASLIIKYQMQKRKKKWRWWFAQNVCVIYDVSIIIMSYDMDNHISKQHVYRNCFTHFFLLCGAYLLPYSFFNPYRHMCEKRKQEMFVTYVLCSCAHDHWHLMKKRKREKETTLNKNEAQFSSVQISWHRTCTRFIPTRFASPASHTP